VQRSRGLGVAGAYTPPQREILMVVTQMVAGISDCDLGGGGDSFEIHRPQRCAQRAGADDKRDEEA
jgi:hypothetical protein